MTERCAWCEKPLTATADPVRVTTKRTRSRSERLHHECAIEWREFITRAERLATIGKRWSLVDGPLEAGWELESGQE